MDKSNAAATRSPATASKAETTAAGANSKFAMKARPRAAPSSQNSRSAKSRKVPKWLAAGASVTGALVAIGATLFATRGEWLPHANKLRETLRGSNEGGEVVRVNEESASDGAHIPVAAPHFETSGAEAGFAVSTAA